MVYVRPLPLAGSFSTTTPLISTLELLLVSPVPSGIMNSSTPALSIKEKPSHWYFLRLSLQISKKKKYCMLNYSRTKKASFWGDALWVFLFLFFSLKLIVAEIGSGPSWSVLPLLYSCKIFFRQIKYKDYILTSRIWVEAPLDSF